MKVFVYYNLHKKLWSVKALEGPNKGRVIAHAYIIYLTDCTFKVSEAGRQRVLKEQRKNVHAGVIGYWDKDDNDPIYLENSRPVTYNPYKYSTFVYKDTQTCIYHAKEALLSNRNVYVQ